VRAGKGDLLREVPVNPLVRQVLDEWLTDRAKDADADQPAMFLAHAGARLSLRAADSVVRKVAAMPRLELSAHVLRHTCLTGLVRRGTDLVTVAELAGRSRVERTRRYSLPSEADRQQAVDDLQSTSNRGGAQWRIRVRSSDTGWSAFPSRSPSGISGRASRSQTPIASSSSRSAVSPAVSVSPSSCAAALPRVRARRPRQPAGRGAGVSSLAKSTRPPTSCCWSTAHSQGRASITSRACASISASARGYSHESPGE
jgi:integrase-like protein